MKIKCAEVQSFTEHNESFLTARKSIDTMVSYLKAYVKETKEYVGNMYSINNKYGTKQKTPSAPLPAIDQYFRRLRVIIDCQINSLARLSDLIENEVSQCEKNITETVECLKKIKLDAVDAEEDYLTQIKGIEKARNAYHNDASTVENHLRTIEKKKRIKQVDDEHQEELQKALMQMIKTEKDYMKKSSKYNMFKQTFIDRLMGSSGSISQFVIEVECKAKDIAYFTMLCLQTSLKEIAAEINSYSSTMEISIDTPHNYTKEKCNEAIQDYNYEAYKIKSMLKENQEDFTEEELHNIIKTIIENTIKKTIDVSIHIL